MEVKISKITRACPDGGHDTEVMTSPYRGQRWTVAEMVRAYRDHQEWAGEVLVEYENFNSKIY